MAGRSGAAQPKMAADSPTGRLTLSNGLHDYLFIYGLCLGLVCLRAICSMVRCKDRGAPSGEWAAVARLPWLHIASPLLCSVMMTIEIVKVADSYIL